MCGPGSIKRHRSEPAAPIPIPSHPSPSSTCAGSFLAALPRELLASASHWMDNREIHNFARTSKYCRDTMIRAGMNSLHNAYLMLNRLADEISRQDIPVLHEMASKIRAIIPKALFGKDGPVPPLKGLFDPLLNNNRREHVIMGIVHDIFTERDKRPGMTYTAAEHRAYHPALFGSIERWEQVRMLMRFFGGAPFDFLSPGQRSEHILEAAGLSHTVLKHLPPQPLYNCPTRELITYAAHLHIGGLTLQASFACYQRVVFNRCRAVGTSMSSAARIANLVRDTEEPMHLPSLSNDKALLNGYSDKVGVISLARVGKRIDARLSYAYRDLCYLNRAEDPILNFVPSWLQTDPEFIASAFKKSTVRFSLCNLSPQSLNVDFWKSVIHMPFSVPDMIGLIPKMRGADGNFTAGVTDEIIFRQICFVGDPTIWPQSTFPLNQLYPKVGDVPCVSVILKSFLAGSDDDRVKWLAVVLKKANEGKGDPFVSAPEIGVILGPFDPNLKEWYEKIASPLAKALMRVSHREAQEQLIADCMAWTFWGVIEVLRTGAMPSAASLPPPPGASFPERLHRSIYQSRHFPLSAAPAAALPPPVALASPAAPPPLPLP